jgi:hypothetical protein
MIFYIVVFSYFSHRDLGVFVQAYCIQIFRFSPLSFFKDNIHLMRCYSALGGVLQHKT